MPAPTSGADRAKSLFDLESLPERLDRLKGWGIDKETSALVVALLDHLSLSGAMRGFGAAVLAPAEPCAPVRRRSGARS